MQKVKSGFSYIIVFLSWVLGGPLEKFKVIWLLLLDAPNAPDKILKSTAIRVQGYKLCVDQDVLEDLVAAQKLKQHEVKNHLVANLQATSSAHAGDRDWAVELDKAVDSFIQAGFMQKVFWLFMSVHPAVGLITLNIHVAHLARALLLSLKILASYSLAAVSLSSWPLDF